MRARHPAFIKQREIGLGEPEARRRIAARVPEGVDGVLGDKVPASSPHG